MDTATAEPRLPSKAEPAARAPLRRFAVAAAGPALIVVSVLIALRGIAFWPNLSDQHPDLLSFWLPRTCLLGRSLAEGHVPLWNPFEMAGTPFAADPQSGWLALPTMVLSWAFGCGNGLRALIVLHPIAAGLGLRWFLRREGLGRVAATAGGLSLAMAMAASIVAISLPFGGTLAWTPYLLVGASGYLSGSGWRRLGWLALAALAWGQVATSHLSHGLVMATGLVTAYVVSRALREVRAGRLAPAAAVALSAGFLAFLPLANLAILVPRFALIERSSLAHGYGALEGTVARAVGTSEGVPIARTGIWGAWPLALAATPGGYLGAGILLFVPLALRDRSRRWLVAALGAVGVAAYLLTSTLLVGAGWFRSLVLSLPYGDVYLHNPGRLRFVVFLVLTALGAVGLRWFLDARPPFASAIRWIGAGLAVFLVFPILAGARPARLVVFAVAAAAVLVAVRGWSRGRRWAPVALCAILAAELLAGALWSSLYRGGTVTFGLETGEHPALVAPPLRWPDVRLERYLQPGAIARELRRERASAGRYLAWIPPDAYFNKGYLFTRSEADWPALLLGRSVLFEIPDTLGYSPVQLPRYWEYVRATNRLPVFYNAAVIQIPTLGDLRLVGARYLIARRDVPLPANVAGETIVTEGAYRLVDVEGAQPRASVVPAWTVAADERAALEVVLDPGFDPASLAVLETDPGIPPSSSGGAGRASYREASPEDVRISVRAPVPSIVLVRNAWDEGWSATVDGRPAPVLRADVLLQAVAVPPGEHEVRLAYREPALARGLALSALVWLGFLVAFGLAWAGRAKPSDEASDAGSGAGTPSGSTGA